MKSKCHIIKIVENYETWFVIKKKGLFFWNPIMEENPYNGTMRIKKFRYLEDAEQYVDKYIINLPAPKETIINEY